MKVEVRRTELTYQNLLNLMGQDEKAVQEHLKSCESKVTATWLGLADGVEACAVGLTAKNIFASDPYLWLIYTKICEQHPVLFIRWSRRVMDEILELYPSVIGLCHCDNILGKRWLTWLGAMFDDSQSSTGYDGFRIARWPLVQ